MLLVCSRSSIRAIRIIGKLGMKNLIAAVLLLGCGSVQAATIIDFNSVAVGSTADPLLVDGFRFQGSGMSIIEESPGDNALL